MEHFIFLSFCQHIFTPGQPKKLTITYFENGIEVDIWHVLQVFNKMKVFEKILCTAF